jgi:hypothetical protein
MSQGSTRGIPIDTDTTLSADSNLLGPSQKAVKTYVDGKTIVDATPTDGSSNAVSSNGVFDALALKQDKVTGVSDTEIGYLDGVTSALQTQINNRLRILSQSVAPTSTVTGTLTETEILKITIPANTMTTTDLLNIQRLTYVRVGASSTATMRVKLSTSSTMPATITDQIALYTITASTQIANFVRGFWQTGGNIAGFANNTTLLNDGVATGGGVSTKAFDPTVTNYLYVSITLGNIGDSIYLGQHLITV